MVTVRKTLKAAKALPGKTDVRRIKFAREALRRAALNDPDCPPLSEAEASELRAVNPEDEEGDSHDQKS